MAANRRRCIPGRMDQGKNISEGRKVHWPTERNKKTYTRIIQ